jgi:hypothetical protein
VFLAVALDDDRRARTVPLDKAKATSTPHQPDVRRRRYCADVRT